MDFIGLFTSVSRIAVAAFIITLIVVAYEVYVIIRKRREEHMPEQEHIDLPDFNSGDAKQGSFSPISVDPSAMQPAEIQSRRVSRPFLIALLVLITLIVLVAGYLIYSRSRVSGPDSDVTPITDSQDDVTALPTVAIPTVEPTFIPETTIDPSAEPTLASVEPTLASDVTSNQETVTPTVGESTMEATSTPMPTGLPQAGSYQTTLIISLMAVAIVYLALIL